MTERDEFDEQTERLLPCCWVELGQDENDKQDPCPLDDPGCAACEKRALVAAALRAAGYRYYQLEKDFNDLRQGYSATGVESWPCPGCKWDAGKLLGLCGLHQQIDNLRREVDKLNKSNIFLYSRTVELKQQETDYLQATCENRNLRTEIAALKAEVERLKHDDKVHGEMWEDCQQEIAALKAALGDAARTVAAEARRTDGNGK